MKNATILILSLVVLIGCQKEKQEEPSLQDMLLGRWNVISYTGVFPSDITPTEFLFPNDKFVLDFDLNKYGTGKCLWFYSSPSFTPTHYYVKFYDFSLNEDTKKLELSEPSNSTIRVLSIDINGDELILNSPKEGDFTNVTYTAERE